MNQESNITVEDIELSVDSLDVEKAADIFEEHGCLVVRGLMKPYVDRINQDMESAASESLALIDEAEKIVEGWAYSQMEHFSFLHLMGMIEINR